MTQRTDKQNKAIHKYCAMRAEALNDAGLDMKTVLKHNVAIPWTQATAKDHLWRPIQQAMLDKESTGDLDTDEVCKVYEVLNRHLAEKKGITVPFPSNEPPPHPRLDR